MIKTMSNPAAELNKNWEQTTEFSNMEAIGNLDKKYSFIITFLLLFPSDIHQIAGSTESSSKLGTEGNFLYLIKDIYQKTYN